MTNLGDLPNKNVDPVETYFDILRQGVRMPKNKWIVAPTWDPQCIPGMQPAQDLIDCHLMPRIWQVLVDLWTKLQCGTYFVKNPNWIEPPVTAIGIDLRTEAAVTVAESASYGTADVAAGVDCTHLAGFAVPDRHVASILCFGHELADATFWGITEWEILINGKPARNYFNFRQQIGRFINPTCFSMPILLKWGDTFSVLARNPVGGGTVGALVRITGFMYPVKALSQDGTFQQYHTL